MDNKQKTRGGTVHLGVHSSIAVRIGFRGPSFGISGTYDFVLNTRFSCTHSTCLASPMGRAMWGQDGMVGTTPGWQFNLYVLRDLDWDTTDLPQMLEMLQNVIMHKRCRWSKMAHTTPSKSGP